MINSFISKLPFFKHDLIYDLIALQNPKLCLDIGAASGYATKKIKDLAPENTKVIAFEPFEGNHQYFYQNTQTFTNVELIKKAVSQNAGTADFCISSIVTGEEKGWEKMPGYSSVGYLGRRKSAKYIKEFSVETVSIDDVISTHVDLMKIDVQGGELDVLLGSKLTMNKYGIDVIYIEYGGEKEILSFLSSQGYILFDTDYMILPKGRIEDSQDHLQSLGFYDLRETNLSNGHSSYKGRFDMPDAEYSSFLRDFKKNYGYIQTDLICVHQTYLQEFICHLASYCNLVTVSSRDDSSASHKHHSDTQRVDNHAEVQKSADQDLQDRWVKPRNSSIRS